MGKDDEEDLEEGKERLPYQYYVHMVVRRVHHFYISEEISDPYRYVEMIHRIKMAGPDEIIFIHLNTPGGRTDTGVQIVNAIQTTQAHVICSVESEVHSMGTLIFLAADEYIVNDNCMMMFHTYSGGVFGKGHEQLSQLKATTDWFAELARKFYVPFMTDEEFDAITKGEDLWLNSTQIRERLVNMVEIMEVAREAEAKALAEPAKTKRAVARKVAPKKKAAPAKKPATRKRKAS